MSPNRHYQAVLMAGGKGSRMAELTGSKPKCLLPVGSFPMIYYPLSLLKKAGFSEVIVVTQESAKNEVLLLSKKYDLGLALDVVCIPHHHEDCGTADSLRRVHDKLSAESIFILSCDLFSDLPVHHLLDLHRVHESSVTALFSKSSLDLKAVTVPGPKAKAKREKDVIGVDLQKPGGGQLCFWSSDADLNEEFSLKRIVLQEHPKIKVFTGLTDAHFYIMEKWVVDFICSDDSLSALKGEVMPYLVKKQFRVVSSDDTSNNKLNEEETPNAKATHVKQGIEAHVKIDPMVEQTQNLSSWNDHIGDMMGAYRNRPLRCYAYIMDGGTCIRANTLHAYCELNRQIASLMPSLSHHHQGKFQPSIHPNANIQPKAQVGFECFVGENTSIAEKTTIKDCVIGANCKISEKVRLTNCIIMDNVTVNSLNNINGSIICEDVVTSQNCELKACIISKGHHFTEGEKRANEVLGSDDDNMMEI